MRKTLMLIMAGLAALLVAASVATSDPNKSVTISASKPVVVYGHTVTLSGKITPPATNQKVDIFAQPSGLSTMSAFSSTETTNGGQWSLDVKPTIETLYQARVNTETSSTVDVKVRPAITLTLVRMRHRVGTFATTAIAARAFAGKFVNVQRVTSFGSVNLKRVTLDTTSKATFRVRLSHKRTRLRVVLPTSQAAPGYIAGFSNVLTVRR
ncbi:MAG: hypothetical protein E6G50_08010 [Actinobacteria bacterium]|nr:MAG: hypothetical protein E6G50_08010 [Actinomycetota bacterium]